MTPVLGNIEIIVAGHEPPLPFMIVNRSGLHLDLSKIGAELWSDQVAHIQWGLTDNTGRVYGRVTYKDGGIRNFAQDELMWPFLKAWMVRKQEEDNKHRTAVLNAMAATVTDVPIGA